MSIPINPLSVAKGQAQSCELCAAPARLMCSKCRVTYYCSATHQNVDAHGIHNTICSLLGALRSLRPTLGSSEERTRRALTVAMSRHALIDLCKNEAHKFLLSKQFDYAICGALQALRFSLLVYGRGRLELVPAYLLLAEACLGLNQLKQAEEYLLYANWSVLQSQTTNQPAGESSNSQSCPASLQASLHRAFGRLYVCQQRYESACSSFAAEVYYSSLDSGPDHIDVCTGIFSLGRAFESRKDIGKALALFDKCIDIWYKFCVSLSNRRTESISDYLTVAQCSEACQSLYHIANARRRHLGSTHLATGEAMFTLGMLKQFTNMDADALFCYTHAEQIYSLALGPDNEATQAIRQQMDQLPETTQQRVNTMTWDEIPSSRQISALATPQSAKDIEESKEQTESRLSSAMVSVDQTITEPVDDTAANIDAIDNMFAVDAMQGVATSLEQLASGDNESTNDSTNESEGVVEQSDDGHPEASAEQDTADSSQVVDGQIPVSVE